MKTKAAAGRSRSRILRREESLKSRQYRGICLRVLYECDGLEILRTELEPGTVLARPDITHLDGMHFVIGGNPHFHVRGHSSELMPGDSIALHDGQDCTVSNPATSRASILSVLFKSSSACLCAGALERGIAESPNREKEISR